MKILHILKGLSGGGPTRQAIALAKLQKQLGMTHQHRLTWLSGDPYPMAMLQAARAGMSVLRPSTPEALQREMSEADVVHLHFWNSPETTRFLCHPWPACRLVLQFTISGLFPPQVITPSLVEFADVCVASPVCFTSPALKNAASQERAIKAPAPIDPDRLAGCELVDHFGFQVGYIGTVDHSKMHPEFVAMSAAIQVPNLRIVLCGKESAQVREQVVQLGAESLFDFRGFVDDLRPVLANLDVFGYPLRADTWALDELSLREAMAVGIPPVVFDHPALLQIVEHNRTGLIVHNSQEYREAIEFLAGHPDQRRRLGDNARAHALEHFQGQDGARKIGAAYEQLGRSPKRARSWSGPRADESAARHFVASLGSFATPFERSLAAPDPEAHASIAASSTLLIGGEGGLMHYRNAYPDDPFLRFWSSLVLRQQARLPAAERELEAARNLGLATNYV